MIPLSKISALVLLLGAGFFSSCHDENNDPVPQNKLVAVAGSDRMVKRKEAIELDASASRDGNDKPFIISWSVKARPQGSNATVAEPHAIKTSFTPDIAGVYIIRLTLSQDSFTAADELTVTALETAGSGPQTLVIKSDINQNTTLADIFDDPTAIDYIVTDDIDVRAELVVMPGVTIAFAENKGIQILTGFIRAKGTPDNRITFRGTGDAPSFWKGVGIHTNGASNEFEYVTIRQGGSSAFAETGVRANLIVAGTTFSGGAVSMTETILSESGGYGFYLQGMSSINAFASNSFLNNASDLFIAANELHKIEPGTITSSKTSVDVETGGVVGSDHPVAWKPVVNGSYLVSTDIFINAGITVEPGAIFKMKNGTAIHVTDPGYLKAVGSEASDISFTSATTVEHWKGVYFNTYSENNQMRYCEISNAGSDKIADADHPGNIVVGHSGVVAIENSIIRNGLGYGVVAKTISQVNANIETVNTFIGLQKGTVFPQMPDETPLPSLSGVWLDGWSFRKNYDNIQDDFYNAETQTWFGGAQNPWAATGNKGMGIRFDEDLKFTWLIAEHSPMTGCESWSAEYITGTATVATAQITFHQDYWRSKFVNSCDETQNVDTEVSPSDIPIAYKIEKMYDVLSGSEYWELKFINPDGSTFSFFRQISTRDDYGRAR